MSKSGTFALNGICAEDYGIILTAPPSDVFAERDVETISVPGRSGDLIVDNGRYQNAQIVYSCAVIPKPAVSMREAATTAVSYLRQFSGYVRLTDTFHPDYFFLAAATKAVTVESIVERAGIFTMTLGRKPQRFLASGETALSFSAAGTLTNPTQFPAQPLIQATGSGAGTVTVGNAVIRIDAMTDSIFFDCETMNAYSLDGEGIPQNRNGDIYAPEFPVLLPGSNPVSWSGGITGVKITPRWWTL